MKKLKFLIPTFSLITISSVICSDIDTEISRGVESKRIEALLAQKIHNITPKYDSQLSFMLKGRDAIFRKIDPSKRIFRKMPPGKMAELREKNVQEKLFFGKKVIESLEARFKGNLEAILQASKQQIAAFIISAADIIGFTTEYIKAGMQDIDMYIAGILQNYHTLKGFIISESKKLLKE